MRAFVVLGLVFPMPSQEIGLGKRLRNDPFCVEWDVKPQLNGSFKPQTAAEDRLVQGSADCAGRRRRGTDAAAGVTGRERAASVYCWGRPPPRHPPAVADTFPSRGRRRPPGRGRLGHCSPAPGGRAAARARRPPSCGGFARQSRGGRTRGRRAAGSGVQWRNGRRRAVSRRAGLSCCGIFPARARASHRSLLCRALQPTNQHIIIIIKYALISVTHNI